jgi:hypothetical protein
MNPMTLIEARKLVLTLVKNEPMRYGWADELPTKSIDEEALAYLANEKTGPSRFIERCNPFAVSEQISDLSSFYDILVELRNDAHAIEATLIRDVLSDVQAELSQPFIEQLAQISVDSDWISANKTPPPPSSQVTELAKIEREERDRRRMFRSTSGHPFNLQEKLLDTRRRYFIYLSRAIAKSEALGFVLKGSFGFLTESLVDEIKKASSDPLVKFGDWLRHISFGLEEHATRETIITLYRLLGADGWLPGIPSIASVLNAAGDTPSLKIEFNSHNLGIGDNEVARILAVGVAPTFGWSGSPSMDDATKNAALLSFGRAMREHISFDANLEFQPVEYLNSSGDRFNYPGFIESFGGIGGWCVGLGPVASALKLRSSSRLTNRPVGGYAYLNMPANARTSWNTVGREAFPLLGHGLPSEMKLSDIAIGIRLAKHSTK